MPDHGRSWAHKGGRAGRWVWSGFIACVALVAWSDLSAQPAQAETPAPVVPRNHGVVFGLSADLEVLDVRGRALGSGTETVERVSPSVTLVNRGGRLRGSLIYSGTLAMRQGIADRDETEYLNSLSANYTLEAFEGIGFIDARAGISQRQVTAEGEPVLGVPSAGRNRSETGTVTLSPYLRGLIGRVAEGEFRLTGTETRTRDDIAGDSRVQQASYFLRSPRTGAMFGWGLSGIHQRVRFLAASAPTNTDRLTAELSVQADVDLRLTVFGGQERTDVVGALKQQYENYGAGLLWTPSPRTTVQLQGEKRYFGHAYRGLVEHRYQRSTFRFSSQRDVNVGADPTSTGQAITLYELYFNQFASVITDPVERDQFVLALLRALGRDRNELVGGGQFSYGGIAASRRNDVVWTWAGPRLTLNVTGFTVDSERVDLGGVNVASQNDNVAQSGYAASAGWRLTPLTSINLTGSRTMSKNKVSLLGSDLKSLSGGLVTQFGPRTTGTFRIAYNVLNGVTDSYRETGVAASLSHRF